MSSSSKTEMAAYYNFLVECAETGESRFIKESTPRIKERIRQYLIRERKRRVREIEEQREQENQTAALQGRLPVWPEGATIPEDQVVVRRHEEGILLEYEDIHNTIEVEFNTKRGKVSAKMGDLIECRHIYKQAYETYSMEEGGYTHSAENRADEEWWRWLEFRQEQRKRGRNFQHFDEDFHRAVNSFLDKLPDPQPPIPDSSPSSIPSEDEQPFGDSIF